MKSKFLWALTIFGLCSSIFVLDSTALAANEPCPTLRQEDLTFSNIKALIKNPSCQIRTISDFLAKLPKDYFSAYGLFYLSRSLQGPNETDYLNPRAIVYGDFFRSKMIITFNGSPSQPGHRALEVLEIRDGTPVNFFDFYEIEFPLNEDEIGNQTWKSVQPRIHFSPANPAKCTACHGQPTHPIFPGYPDWTGAFGSRHSYEQTPEEQMGYAQYQQNLAVRGSSRYQFLEPKQLSEFDTMEHNLHGTLGSAYHSTMAKIATQTPNYSRFKYAIAAALLDCEKFPSYLPPSLFSELLANMNRQFNLKEKWPDAELNQFWKITHENPRQFGLSSFSEDSFENFVSKLTDFLGGNPDFVRLQADTFKVQGISREDTTSGNLRLLLEGRGISMDKWSLDLTRSTYRIEDGAVGPVRTVGKMRQLDPDLAPIVPLDFETQLRQKGGSIADKMCEQLKPFSLRALRGFHAAKVEPPAPEPLGNSYPRTFTQVCASCHDSKTSNIGPHIPFTQPEKMSQWMSDSKHRKRLQEKVLASEASARMPPTRLLTESELNSILNYLSHY